MLAFFVLGVVGLRHHEMWRDELYPWLVARDSPSIRDLFRITQYDSHFRLWHLALWLVTRFTHNCKAMQWLHLILATLAVWLLVRFSPFTRWQKALFCFGYFPFYEYCVISRCYVLIVLLAFLFCALFTARRRSYIALGAVLFLLSNVNIFGTIMAISLGSVLAVEYLPMRKSEGLWKTSRSDVLGGACLFVLGLGSAALQIAIRPHDSTVSAGWQHPLTGSGVATAWINIWSAYVPVSWEFPILKNFTWGDNYLTTGYPGARPLAVALALGLVAVSTAMLRRSRPALVCYLGGISLFLLFYCFVASGALRHWGIVFILFLASVWLAWSPRPAERPSPTGQQLHWENPFLFGLLTVHVLAGLYAWIADFRYPFSTSKWTAGYIQEHGLQNLPIVGDDQIKVSTLSAYLDRPIYYLDDNRLGTFSISTTAAQRLPSTEEIFRKVAELLAERHTDLLLVLTGMLAGPEHEGHRPPLLSAWLDPDGTLELTPHSGGATSSQIALLFIPSAPITDEMFCLYDVRPATPSPSIR